MMRGASALQGEEQRCLNSELWHACAGPLVSLPAIGSRVVYFPQGHSEQVAASTNKEIDTQIPNYPSLPPQLICQLHNVTMHADVETDEVYAQMTLQPLGSQEQKDPYLPAELGAPNKQPTNFFCKTLTASDTSTHGGFSVPRRAAEKVLPPLDFTQQPPCQELIAKDLHGHEWKFRHIFRGQPKRHLLTTGWSVFVSAKRLVTGDSVLFIWNENNQLLLGIRHANRPQTVTPSSVLSSDSMHIGLLAAAAHAAATNSRFTIFYNPRQSPSEFVIPLAKYAKAAYHTRVSVGMRFRMLFETEESSVRRYMGTITGICDLDPVRWPNSHWRSVKVGWDESAAGMRQPRVSLWEIEPLTTFPMYPSPFSLRLKRPWPSELPFIHEGSADYASLNPQFMWLGDGNLGMQSMNFNGLGVTPWMQPRFDSSLLGLQPDVYQQFTAAALHEVRAVNPQNPLSPAIMHFQQPRSTNSSTPQANQVGQQLQPRSELAALQPTQESQVHTESQLPQQQLQYCHSLGDKQQQMQSPQSHQHGLHLPLRQHQHRHHQAGHQQLHSRQEIPNELSSLSATQSQSTPLNTTATLFHPNFPDTDFAPMSTSALFPLQSSLGSYSREESSNLSFLGKNYLLNPDARPSKRTTIECSGTHSVPSQVEHLCSPRTNISQLQHSVPFSERGCTLDQESSTDPQSPLVFGVNMDSPHLLGQRGMGDEIGATAVPFPFTNFLGTMGTKLPLNQAFMSSGCLEESGFLKSVDNPGHENRQNGIFVKVYKSGSFGRSLDISKFNCYPELRRELGRLFGLEGLLEDPIRSGWQLIFVDRENDVLLIGDDPWQEFVNNVWCIKILSPQDVQKMAHEGVDLLSSDAAKRLSSGSYEDIVSRASSTNLSNGITSVVGLLDY